MDKCITATIQEYFQCDGKSDEKRERNINNSIEMKFSASGREDIDVRMLGDGYVFYPRKPIPLTYKSDDHLWWNS